MNEEWKAKKPSVYCRPHGRRILIFVNGIGSCKRCVSEALAEEAKKQKNSA